MSELAKTDVLILCGGLGTRLRSEIGESQKVMAKIEKQPFLDILLTKIARQGGQRVILCSGYQADSLEQYYRKKNLGLTIEFSREQEPLGTGGAIKNACPMILSESFFVLNGDCFSPVNFNDVLFYHQKRKTLVTIVVARIEKKNELKDYGTIQMTPDTRIQEFLEKVERHDGSPLVNAGVYCFRRDICQRMPEKNKFSVERDVFPALIKDGIYGFEVKEFIDIGTPERYKKAQKLLTKAGSLWPEK